MTTTREKTNSVSALTQSLALAFERTSNCGRLWAWSALRVGSVPPGFSRAVFFVALKNAASSAIVIVASRCPRNSRSTTSGTALGTPFPSARSESRHC